MEHIGKAQSVAACPHWPVHKEDVTLQVLRTGAFYRSGTRRKPEIVIFLTGFTDLHYKAGKKTCTSSALTVGLLNYTYQLY